MLLAVISLRINSLNLDRERVEGGSRVENLWLEAGAARGVFIRLKIDDPRRRSQSAGGQSVLMENNSR